MKKAFIIGNTGNIGSEAVRALRAPYYIVGVANSREFIPACGKTITFNRRGDPDEIASIVGPFCAEQRVDLGVIAIPSNDNGTTEFTFITGLLEHGVQAIVTSGKAALAYHPDLLAPHLPKIGFTATVGGGTAMLPWLSRMIDPRSDFVIDVVVNGTLSFVMTAVWGGLSVESAWEEAEHLKFAEPRKNGEEMDVLAGFRGEIGDIVKKLTIMFNVVPQLRERAGFTVTPRDFNSVMLTEERLYEVTAANARKKYVVRIGTIHRPLIGMKASNPGSIHAHIGGLHVLGGFCDIPMGTAFDRFVPNAGPGNAVSIDQRGTPLELKGQGAGPRATVKTMLADAFRLCPPN